MNIKNILPLFISLCFVFTASAQTAQNFPKAEWDKATVILMHTPGEELFNGVNHPRAGLFEYYFDVDAAAKEHHNYISMLQHNGIKVYNVAYILESISIDTLRSLAGQSLTYDIHALWDKNDTTAFGQNYKHAVVQHMSKKDLIR